MPGKGRPFGAGKPSANPTGRPKAVPGLRAELERRYGTDGRKLVETLDELRQHRDPKIKMQATELLLAYLVGKPTQAVNMDVTGDILLRWQGTDDADA